MSAPHRLSLIQLLPGMLAFLTLGFFQAFYGPAFPLFAQRYGLGLGTVALITTAHFIGSAQAPLLGGLALLRWGPLAVVSVGLSLLLLGVLGVALAPSWVLALLCAGLAGLGLGSTGVAFNSLYASWGSGAVNLVNAVFGLGSIAAPWLVSTHPWTAPTAPLLMVVAGAGLSLLLVRWLGVPAYGTQLGSSVSTGPFSRHWPLVLLFMLVLGGSVGLEVSLGAWTAQHLTSLHHPHPALVVSGYWLGFTLVRLGLGLLGSRLPEPPVILSGALLSALALILAWRAPAFAPWAYLLAGVAVGPLFPTTLAWMARLLPRPLFPFVLIAGSLGGAIFPAVLGQLQEGRSPALIPLLLLSLALGLGVVIALTIWGQQRWAGR